MIWERNLISQDIGECGVAVLPLERRRPEQHLVHQDSQSPPINSTGVAIAFDDLRCDVFLSADKGVGSEVSHHRAGVDSLDDVFLQKRKINLQIIYPKLQRRHLGTHSEK